MDGIEIPVKVTEDMLNGVFVAAIEGGTDYWAEVENYRWNAEKHGPEWGCTLYDMEEGNRRHVITRNTIILGITRTLASDSPGIRRHGFNLLTGNDDSETGDVIVQMALFGEVVYG